MKTRGFFLSDVQIQPNESYVSVEEPIGIRVFFNSLPISRVSFNHFPRLHQLIFFLAETRSQPSQTCRCSPHLGSQLATPNCLGGKPPRVTNASKLSQHEPQVLKLWIALLSSQLLSIDLSLPPNSQDLTRITQPHKEGLGRAFLGFGLAQDEQGTLFLPQEQQPPREEVMGYKYPKAQKLAVGHTDQTGLY